MIKSLLSLSLVLSFTCNAESIVDLAKKCAPEVSTDTILALVKTESSFNPYAIGVVGGSIKQPSSLDEALSAVEKLEREGKNYSVGLGQINKGNFKRLHVNARTMFDPCENLKATQIILAENYERTDHKKSVGARLADAMSMYYSGNTRTGFEHGYVDRISDSAVKNEMKVPSVKFLTNYMHKTSDDPSESLIVSVKEQTVQKVQEKSLIKKSSFVVHKEIFSSNTNSPKQTKLIFNN